jgi:hypothetical protein
VFVRPILNNFRQNVQESGLFDAPDATVSLSAVCVTPVKMVVSVRNIGLSGLPAGVEVGIFNVTASDELLGHVATSNMLLPGQTEVLDFEAPIDLAKTTDLFQARIIIDPEKPTFHECREDNNDSEEVRRGLRPLGLVFCPNS